MCGIAGIINYNHSEDKRDLLKKMIGLIQHRGPDASGIYINGPVGLGHARLSIIDLSSNGDQPIHNEDKTIWIVFNGEIFNYPELRNELIGKGHTFYTKTDTEVLIHLYEEFGTDMFPKLNGQFAFAIWDQRDHSLLLGRDRVGIRPLFYHYSNNRFSFASEIKALLADANLAHRLNPEAISDIFTCWTTLGPATPFENIYQIPAGHYAKLTNSAFTIEPYWKVSFDDNDTDNMSLSDWSEALSGLIRDASRIRLRADVPVGSYLSGGIDSTFISSVVKKNFNNLLNTFSVSFTDDRFDESSYQKKSVHMLKTDHQDIRCTENNIGENFPRVVWHTETPITRTAPVPLFMLSKLVREKNFKVVLTGEGADEIFAGYNIFREDKVRRFWARQPESILRPKLLEKLYPYIFSSGDGRQKRFIEAFFKKNLNATSSVAYSHLLRWQNTAQLKTFFTDEFKARGGSLNRFVHRLEATLPGNLMSWDPLSRAQYIEISTFLSNYLLSSQGDRMAMANSVEGRYPFLDHRVIEFACKVPPRFRMNGLDEKYILKHTATGMIPSEIIKRPKQPYRAPISRCFFGDKQLDYVEDLLSEKSIKQKGYFDAKKVSSLVNKCRKQDGQLLSERENMALVGILSTQLVDEQFINNFPAYPIKEPKNLKICN
jgi:asparagine synthase (glutamine-hydrolysing)